MILLLIIIFIILFLYFRFKFPKEVNILILRLKKLILGKKKKKRKNKNNMNTSNISDKSKLDILNKENYDTKSNIEKARSELRKLINKNEENLEQTKTTQIEDSRPPSPTLTEVFRLDSNELLNHAMELE
jgi:hypothetical protein